MSTQKLLCNQCGCDPAKQKLAEAVRRLYWCEQCRADVFHQGTRNGTGWPILQRLIKQYGHVRVLEAWDEEAALCEGQFQLAEPERYVADRGEIRTMDKLWYYIREDESLAVGPFPNKLLARRAVDSLPL